jgi:hypothetical protein
MNCNPRLLLLLRTKTSSPCTSRAFSTAHLHSNPNYKPPFLPTFPKTSSSNLDSSLKLIQEQILVPVYLSKAQRRILRNKPASRSPKANPRSNVPAYSSSDTSLTLRIGDVDLTLRPEAPDAPRKRSGFRTHVFLDAVKHTATNEDWRVWKDVFRGYDSAGVPIRQVVKAMWVRKALEGGQLELVLEMVKGAKWSGISLKDAELRDMVFKAVREKAEAEGWEREEVERMRKMATGLLVRMETKEHLVEEVAVDERSGADKIIKKPGRSLLAVGVPLEMSYRLSKMPAPTLEAEPEAVEAAADETAEGEAETEQSAIEPPREVDYTRVSRDLALRMITFPDFIHLVSSSSGLSTTNTPSQANSNKNLAEIVPLISHLKAPITPYGFLSVGHALQSAKMVLEEPSQQQLVRKALDNLEYAFENFKFVGNDVTAAKEKYFNGERLDV